ncbi:MAG: Cellulosome-anchoring protein precursor [Firmicutes bacterium ADurb.Bin456]|nr:MAG: Cellulosome-anchoring protein precursor [Firmicutes bacterium ADurb.Bin456]
MVFFRVRGSLSFIIAALLFLAFCGAALAQEAETPFIPLQYPAIFFGSITSEGGQALESGTVRAYVEGEFCGELPFEAGTYGLPSDSPYVKRLLVYSNRTNLTGKEVSFRVFTGGGEYQAATRPPRVTWEAGMRMQVDLVVSPEPAIFADMEGHWAAGQVKQLVAKDIINGYEDHQFRPENKITRAEAAAVLARALSLPEGDYGKLMAFSDGSAIAPWAAGPVAAVVEKGLFQGYPEGNGKTAFYPEKTITRVELAAIVSRVQVQKQGVGESPAANFTDQAAIPAWAGEGVATAVQRGLVRGYPDNTFRPAGEVTRAEAAAVIARLLEQI